MLVILQDARYFAGFWPFEMAKQRGPHCNRFVLIQLQRTVTHLFRFRTKNKLKKVAFLKNMRKVEK